MMDTFRTTQRLPLKFIVLLASLYAGTRVVAFAISPGVDLEQIKSSWIAKQKAIETCDIFWRSTEFRDASRVISRYDLEFANNPEKALNAKDATYESRHRFILDELGRMRIDSTSMTWSNEKQSLVPKELQKVFDTENETSLFPFSNLEYPSAVITKGTARESARSIVLLPLRLVIRTLDEDVGVFENNSQLELYGDAVVDGKQCIVVRQPPKNGFKLDIRIFADLNRDYLPLGYESRLSGRLLQEVRITEALNVAGTIWLPTKWTIVRVFDAAGKALWSDSAEVEKFEYNKPIKDSLFSLDFPYGTLVTNTVTDEVYIVKKDQSKRPVLKGEFTGTNHAELVTTEPGELINGSLSQPQINSWLFSVNLLIVLALVAVLIMRKYRAAR